jgi:RNA polymerase sigma factor (sigma-70 family)
MATGQAGTVLRHIRKLIGVPPVGETTDSQLLEQFTALQEEPAFTELVRRHGSLVLSVCRGVLHDVHDAEDAFQATFLVLAHKAGSIRKQKSVGSWLYGVAYRIALKAKVQAAQRRAHEREATCMAPSDPLAEVDLRELRPLLFEELDRLPTTYRAAVVLCYLEGKTNEEAARQLQWPLGTVKGRLTRARDLLRNRLTRRGLTLSAGLVATVLSEQAASAVVPPALAETTIKAAALVAAGKAAGVGVSAPVAALTEGALHDMFLTKLKIAAAFVLALTLIGAGVCVTTYHTLAAEQPPAKKVDAAPEPPPPVVVDPKPEPARERKFDSTLPLMVFQLIGRSQSKYLGTTPPANRKGIVIAAGAVWYVAPPNGAIGFCGGFGLLGGGIGVVGGGNANPGGQLRAVGVAGGGIGNAGVPGGALGANGFGGGVLGAPGANGFGGGAAGFGGGFGFNGGGAGFAGGGNFPGKAPNAKMPVFGPKLTDKEMKALVAEIKKQSIPGLGIEYHPEFTDAELAQLKQLTALQTLVLRDTGVTDAGLKHLQNLKALQTLVIEDKGITGKGLEDVKNLTRLRTLQLSGPKIDDSSIQPLGQFSGLKTLRLRWTKIDDDGLKVLAGLDTLKSVNGLEELEIIGGAITDKGLAHLRDLAGLKKLRLYLTKITDDGLEHLKDLPELKVLVIDCCSDGIGFVFGANGKFVGMGGGGFGGGGAIGGGGFGGGGLGQMNLFTPDGPIAIPTGKVTNAGLKHLKGMKKLAQLGVTSWHITDAGLENLKDLTSLKWLQLGSPEITDKGLAHLKGMSELETLDLMATQTTGGGAAHLKNLPKLKVLYVAVFGTDKDVTQYRRTLFRTKIQKCDVFNPFGQAGVGVFGGAGFARPN